jgi:16S rRNA pseudouridine516 synthase
MSAVVATQLRKQFRTESTRTVRLSALLARLGLCERADVAAFLRANRVELRGAKLHAPNARVAAAHLRVNGEALRFLPPAVVVLHKPVGVVCSRAKADAVEGRLVHDLFSPEFVRRRFARHQIAGRLDRMASGLCVLTDNGLLNNFLRARLPKVYEIQVAQPFAGNEADVFAAGSLQLKHEPMPCLPAHFLPLTDRSARITLFEGRYRQLRRMFGALGNRVVAIHRTSLAGIPLGDLRPGDWRVLDDRELDALLDQRSMRIPPTHRRSPAPPTRPPQPLPPRVPAAVLRAEAKELDFEDGDEDDEGMRLMQDDNEDDDEEEEDEVVLHRR